MVFFWIMSNSCCSVVTWEPLRDIMEKQSINLNQVAELLIAGAADKSASDLKNCCPRFRHNSVFFLATTQSVLLFLAEEKVVKWSNRMGKKKILLPTSLYPKPLNNQRAFFGTASNDKSRCKIDPKTVQLHFNMVWQSKTLKHRTCTLCEHTVDVGEGHGVVTCVLISPPLLFRVGLAS